MQYDRDFKYLHKKQIIYRSSPINDKPTVEYEWGSYYENGTYECYTLFASKAKINTFKALKWHLHVLWFLNPKLSTDDLYELSKYICKKENGFVTFNVSDQSLNTINYEVGLCDLEKPPANKLRKIIFNDACKLTAHEKLSIVGSMIGKKRLSESEIYDAMILLHDNNEKITINKLAESLSCTMRTIHRNISNELKKEKELLNKEL